MPFELIENQLLVLVDEPGGNTGRIFQQDFRSTRDFIIPAAPYDPENPPSPLPEATTNDHVVFVKEMATDVEIDNVTYKAMHRNAVVGVITGE